MFCRCMYFPVIWEMSQLHPIVTQMSHPIDYSEAALVFCGKRVALLPDLQTEFRKLRGKEKDMPWVLIGLDD